jgi:hypothetical protein
MRSKLADTDFWRAGRIGAHLDSGCAVKYCTLVFDNQQKPKTEKIKHQFTDGLWVSTGRGMGYDRVDCSLQAAFDFMLLNSRLLLCY